MTKEAWIFLVVMAVLIWIAGKIGDALGNRSKSRKAMNMESRADQIKDIFQYQDAIDDLITKFNSFQDTFAMKIPEKHALAVTMRDPHAIDRLSEIEKAFNNCVHDAFAVKEQIDLTLSRQVLDMDLYNSFENIITYMDMYIDELDKVDPEPYNTEERDIYERSKKAGEYMHDYQERQEQEQEQKREQERERREYEQQQYYQQQQQQDYQQQQTNQAQNNVDSYFEGCNSKEEVEKRYKALAKVFHPDSQTGDNTAFKNLQEAYENAKKKY